MKTGKIIPNGVVLQAHEMATVVLLTENGYDVELVPKSNKKGERSPDIKMQGIFWEIKCPKGQGKYLIQNTLHKAARQSKNVIIDLSRIKIHQASCLSKIQKEFERTKFLKRIKVITKARKIVDFKR